MIAVLFRKLQKRNVDLRPKTFASLAHLNNGGLGPTGMPVLLSRPSLMSFRVESDTAGTGGQACAPEQ